MYRGLLLLSLAAAACQAGGGTRAPTPSGEGGGPGAPVTPPRPDAGPGAGPDGGRPDVADTTSPDGAVSADRPATPAGPDGAVPADRPATPAGPDAAAGDAHSPPTPADAGPEPFAAAAVFAPDVLHRIEIRVDGQYLAQLDKDQESRVPCTVTYDGTTLAMSGIRKKGGNGSLRPLNGKPGFSIKFNQFVMGQKLLGLSKLLLNNAVQDPSFLAEHMAYELARRSGAAAPLTAHGLVTFNGAPYGLYVVREAVNDDFLRRSFGRGNQDGNLYEGGEFIESPDSPELKDEDEEMRSRDDVREISRLVRTTPDAQWVTVVGAKLDIASFLTGWVVESLVDHWDGYFFGPHNYYVYNHPGTGRFVFLVAGMDSIFGSVRDPRLDPKVLLAEKFLRFPETRAQLRAKLLEVVGTLNVAELHARIDRAGRTVHSHSPTDARTRADFQSFDANLPDMKANMATIKAWRVPAF